MSKRSQILVIEPVRLSGHRIRRALPEQSFEVIELSSPNMGRKQLALSRPLLVFVSVPDEATGIYPFCREVASKGIPLILLEPNPTKASVIEAVRCGALDVMVCPPPESLIASRVRKVLVKLGRALPQPGEKSKIDFPESVKAPRSRVDYVIKEAQSLLALPHAVSSVLRLCSRPDTSAVDLVPPIETDSAIAASVFRVVNSAAMGGVHPVTDLRNAIARLGMKATSNLAMAQSVFGMFDRKGDTLGFDRTEYWVHSLGTACCARALASVWKVADPDDAFLAGLLHDFGKMLLDEYLPVEYQQAVRDANVEGDPVRIAERKKLEVDHAYVGGRVAEQWGLPGHFSHAIADHHKYEKLLKRDDSEAPQKDKSLAVARCTCLANQLAKAFGFGHAGDFLVETESLTLWRELDSVELDVSKLYSNVRDDLCEMLDLLHLSTKELGLELEEPGSERVLLCLPEGEPQYRIPLEAFFARLGHSSVTRPTLEGATTEDAPFLIGVTTVSGTLDDVKQAAQKLIERVPAVIVFADCPEVGKEGTKLNERTAAVPQRLDFYVLSKHVSEVLSPPDSPPS